jgi:hypothetical protein
VDVRSMGGRHGRRRNTTPVGGVDGQHYSPFTCTHMALVEASLGVLLFIYFSFCFGITVYHDDIRD